MSRTIEEIRDGYSFDSSCQGSVPEAIIAFLESTNFEDAIRLAISLGGDADTQASISGAIAGAFYKEISIDIIETVIKKLPAELLDILRSFNEFVPPKEISLAVTTKKTVKLMCKVQYIFAVACTNIIEVTIPQGTRLELTSIPMSDINSNEEYATFHIITNKKTIFALVENEARLKYSEFLEEYDYLVERIMLFSKISDLGDFEISTLTEDDFLE